MDRILLGKQPTRSSSATLRSASASSVQCRRRSKAPIRSALARAGLSWLPASTLLLATALLAAPTAPALGQELQELASPGPAAAGGFAPPERFVRRGAEVGAVVAGGHSLADRNLLDHNSLGPSSLGRSSAGHREVGRNSAVDWLASWGLTVAPSSIAPQEGAAPNDFVGEDFAVADHFEAFAATEDLDSASIAYNPARSEYLVVWHAFVRETATDIYGRRLSASGTPIGSEFLICDAAGVQAVPHVAYEATTGNYWVTWTDFRTGPVPDVMVRRVSGTGQLVGSEIIVNGPVNEAFASRVACGSGRCVVVWQNAESDGDAHILIHGYEANGSAFSLIYLLTDVDGIAAEPDVCFNATDQHFAVVWQRANGNHWDVSMFRLTRDLAGASSTVSTASGHQQLARIAYNSVAGRYLVVWQDGRSGTNWDVYGQLVGRDGSLYGAALAIYRGTYHDVRPVVAAHGSSSELVVAFGRDISGAEQYQIYGVQVTGTGSVGSAFPIRLWYNIRWSAAVVHRANTTEYLAAWTDLGSAIQVDIQAQRLQSNSTLVGNLINVSVGRKGQETPATAYNSVRNEYLTVWADYRSGSDYDLYVRRVGPTGALLNVEILIATASFLYGVPEVAYDRFNDQYLVVWQEVTSPSSGYEIYAQRLSHLGELRGSAFHVSSGTHAVNEGMPVVVFNSVSREFLIVWHAFTSGLWRVWGQRVSQAGGLVGGNFTISASTKDAQAPRLVHNPARNEYVAVWLDLRNSRVDVYGQRLTATGARSAAADLAISTATGNKGRCDLDYNAADGNYLVVWGDNRATSSDIYGQMLGPTALLDGPNFPISASDVSEVAPLVSWDPVSGTFLVAWWEYHDTTDYDLWAVTVSGTGTVAGDWFVIADALEVQRALHLSRGAANGITLLVWQDFRNTNYDIYGRLWEAASCRRDGMTLCLNDSRFEVWATWRTNQGATGEAHVAYLDGARMESADSGVFYFFRDDNWEQQVKVLDACGVNGKYWVFAAATTNVQYNLTVTDTETNSTVSYLNPLGNPSPAITDTAAFDCAATDETHITKVLTAPDAGVTRTVGSAAPAACVRGGTNLCLGSGRFKVQTSWETAQGATGTSHVAAIGSTRMESADSGIFYFFQAPNWEQQVKVLDACSVNGNYWVFAAATTNVEYDLVVTDSQTGRKLTYHNPLGNPSPAVTDTVAFPCP